MATRGELFSGTETPPPHLALDLGRLQGWLAAHIEGATGPLSAEKFKGGQSNPTYLLTAGARKFVLRRRPPGKLLPSAHAIDREFAVMQKVASCGVPVPAPIAYCEDESVIGSQFYIAAYVQGRIFWEADLPGVSSPDERAAIYASLCDTLARLHSLDVDQAGLAGFGRSGHYCERNFERWSRVYRDSRLVDVPDMEWLMQQLPMHMPAREASRLIHGDYGLYNVITAPDGPQLLAVLDWEMATLGDPLVDLAHHLRAWWDIPDPQGSATSLQGKDLEALGIPSMDAYIANYCRHEGMAVPDMRFHLAYAQYRYAAMIQGILKRVQDGTASARTVLHRQERVFDIARLARRTLEEGVIRI